MTNLENHIPQTIKESVSESSCLSYCGFVEVRGEQFDNPAGQYVRGFRTALS